MIVMLFSALLTFSNYPLNPVEQDTVASSNIHFTAGVNGPNGILGSGFDGSLKFEMLMTHPYIVRAAAELRKSTIINMSYPRGYILATTFALEGLYYRGTNRLSGFIGLGLVYVVSSVKQNEADKLRLFLAEGVNDVQIKDTFGYRLILGARFRRSFSLEIVITELKSDFIYITRISQSSFIEETIRTRLSNIKLTFGYLFSLGF